VLRPCAYVRLSVLFVCTSVVLFATDGGAIAQAQQPSKPEENAGVEKSQRSELEKEIAAVKAENEAIREQLRKTEEQQKALLEMIDRLQRRLEGPAAADTGPLGKPIEPTTNAASAPAATAAVNARQPTTNAGGASALPEVTPKQGLSVR